MSKRFKPDSTTPNEVASEERDSPTQENGAEGEQNRRLTTTAVSFYLNFRSINPLSIAAIEIQATIYLRYNIMVPPERLYQLSTALVELNMDRYLRLCARLRLRLIQSNGTTMTVNAAIPALIAFVTADSQFVSAMERFVARYAYGK